MAGLLGEQLHLDAAKAPVADRDGLLQLPLDQQAILGVKHAATGEVRHAIVEDAAAQVGETVQLVGDQGLAGVDQDFQVANDAGLVIGQRTQALR
ncbi:hypothetical protein D3C76_1645990 [compost metagenome]